MAEVPTEMTLSQETLSHDLQRFFL